MRFTWYYVILSLYFAPRYPGCCETGELDEKVVVAKIATTIQHGAIPGETQKQKIFNRVALKVRENL